MSPCHTDGPIFKSILRLYQPTPDCLFSSSLAVPTFYHFLSPPCCLTSFSTATSANPLPPSTLQCQSLSPPLLLFLFSYLQSSRSISLLFSLSYFQQLSRSRSLSITLIAPISSLSLSLFFFQSSTHSLTLSIFLSQAANGEQNHHN